MKKVLLAGLVILVVGVLGVAANGKIAPLSWGLWGDINLDSGVGSRGYDVVSYHTTGIPKAGLGEYSSDFNGAKWLFSTPENKRLFDETPDRYVPMYGGFCAYAVYNNVTANVNPAIWHIEDGQLYLFASESTKRDWISDIAQGAVDISDHNWAQR